MQTITSNISGMRAKLHSALALALLFSLSAKAQMNNVVEVENDFKPTLKDANKINSLPNIEQTTVNHYNVDYTTKSFPTTNYAFQPMWAAHNNQIVRPDKKGFITLGYGSANNVMGKLAYGFDLSDKDRLNISFASRGHKAEIDHIAGNEQQWESRLFTNNLHAGYEHFLTPLSTFFVNADYGTDLFNYQTMTLTPNGTDKQHNDRINIGAGMTPYSFGQFSLGAKADLQLFKQKHATVFAEGASETIISGNITPEYQFSNSVKADISLDVANTSYGMDAPLGSETSIKGYTTLSASPHVYISSDKADIKLGAYINNDMDIAPDVNLTLHINPTLDVYLAAGGGTRANDFRRYSQMSPYWVLMTRDTELKPQFDQLRSQGGIRLKPAKDMLIDLGAGYDISKNRAEIADYMMNDETADYLYAPIVFADGKRLFANLNLQYNHQDLVTVDLNAQYNKWDTDMEIEGINTDILWQPMVQADCKAMFQPLKNLHVGVDCLFETFSKKDGRYERENTLNLGATLSYTFPCRLTIYAKGDNLLNKSYDQYIMYRTPGMNFMAGAALTF